MATGKRTGDINEISDPKHSNKGYPDLKKSPISASERKFWDKNPHIIDDIGFKNPQFLRVNPQI